MIKKAVILLTVLTYGTNLLLYLVLKFGKKKRSLMEKGSIFLAANMSLLFVDGILAFLAKMMADDVSLFNLM